MPAVKGSLPSHTPQRASGALNQRAMLASAIAQARSASSAIELRARELLDGDRRCFGGGHFLRRIFMSRFIVQMIGGCALALALGEGAAVAAPACVSFMGLTHCPTTDSTTLQISNGQLVATASNGHGGVAITTNATEWRGESRVETSDALGVANRALSIANDVVTSTTDAVHAANGLRLRATFTASANPTFRADVYRDGQLQGSSSKIASGATGAVLGYKLDWPSTLPEFVVSPGGECTWIYRTVDAKDLPITLPDGRKLTGDEVRFSEEVNPQGAYPYLTFNKIVFEGDFQRVRFLSESVK
jgi:hypothetical protein